MDRKRLIPVVAAVGGVIGAVLRGLNLLTGYEPETNLPIAGNGAQTALIVLSVLTAAVLFVCARGFRADRGAVFEEMFGSSSAGFKVLSVLAGLVMIAAGAGGFYLLLPQFSGQSSIFSLLPLIPLWLLAILTGGCFIGLAAALSRRAVTETTAAMTVVPMFWSCFDLIITFKDNGASPFVGLYAVELFAAIALTYAFYALAGFLYSRSSPFRFAVSAGLAVFFCLTTVGGAAIHFLAGGTAPDGETLMRYVCFLAAGGWMLGLITVQGKLVMSNE